MIKWFGSLFSKDRERRRVPQGMLPITVGAFTVAAGVFSAVVCDDDDDRVDSVRLHRLRSKRGGESRKLKTSRISGRVELWKILS